MWSGDGACEISFFKYLDFFLHCSKLPPRSDNTLRFAGRQSLFHIAVNFHPEVRIYWKLYHLQGGSQFSYIAVNLHPEVRIYWKTLPLALRQSLFLHCSKLPSWSEKLLKNLTTCRAAVTFLHCSKLPSWSENLLKTLPLAGWQSLSYISIVFPGPPNFVTEICLL